MNSAVSFTVQNLVGQFQQWLNERETSQSRPAVGQRLLIQPGELYHPTPGYATLQVLEGRAWVTHSGLDMLLVTGEQVELTGRDTDLAITPLSNRPVRVVLR